MLFFSPDSFIPASHAAYLTRAVAFAYNVNDRHEISWLCSCRSWVAAATQLAVKLLVIQPQWERLLGEKVNIILGLVRVYCGGRLATCSALEVVSYNLIQWQTFEGWAIYYYSNFKKNGLCEVAQVAFMDLIKMHFLNSLSDYLLRIWPEYSCVASFSLYDVSQLISVLPCLAWNNLELLFAIWTLAGAQWEGNHSQSLEAWIW